ncbi:MAG TPA: O-antigen ligase family protein [Pseudolabrys sp.]|jgi:O-antigen ligase
MPLATGKHYDHLTKAADWLAVAVAASLPWSTSATAILVVAWLAVVIPTLEWTGLRRDLLTPAGGLPVLLVLLGVLGTLWADVTWLERWKGLDSFCKLLVIPLLLFHFRRSERGTCVFIGYLVACLLLMLLSWTFFLFPATTFMFTRDVAVPVKNAATQSGEFVTCIFGLLYLAIIAFEQRRWLWMAGLVAVALGFLGNILYVATGRTALVIILVLLALLALRTLSAKGVAILAVAALAVGSLGWMSSPHLRDRTTQLWTDYEKYEVRDEKNSSGERLEFYKKSVAFISEAPLFGHGTGTIPALFAKAVIGEKGSAASLSSNPHNQTFAVAIQIGLLGALVLWAMWIAHLLLFRSAGQAEWIGLVVVVQNIVGSLFNSHLFDFGQGWIYVFGVGVAGGMALKNRAARVP